MAELVDALVSNTSGFTSMPVRSRLWVLLNPHIRLIIRKIWGFFIFYRQITGNYLKRIFNKIIKFPITKIENNQPSQSIRLDILNNNYWIISCKFLFVFNRLVSKSEYHKEWYLIIESYPVFNMVFIKLSTLGKVGKQRKWRKKMSTIPTFPKIPKNKSNEYWWIFFQK